jgi:tetratricopeptide (TPR) repeat protein
LQFLRATGVATLGAREYPRAAALAFDRDSTRLSLGIALQRARRHEEALSQLVGVSERAPERAVARLYAAFSLLALGRASEALTSAREALERIPRSASGHSAVGQAELALGRAGLAVTAFLASLAIDPHAADTWTLLAAARERAGDRNGSASALRRALSVNSNHVGARAALASKGDNLDRNFEVWAPTDQRVALGLAVDYLSKKATFGKLRFGEWTRTLAHQVGRGHQLFVVNGEKRVCGFLGWALTNETLARDWMRGLKGLSDEQCREGDCLIINAWAADSREALRYLVQEARRLFANKRALYFKRLYRDGHARPMRLSIRTRPLD